MATIRPAEELGSVLAGRSEAVVLRTRVEQLAGGDEPVTVDFAGVLTASPSFADEFFAKLDPELIEDGRVVLEGLAPSIASIARYVRTGRARPLSA